MITVLCTHCELRRHAPCSMVCKIETHSTDAQDKPAPKPVP